MPSFIKRVSRLFGLEIKRCAPGIDLHTDLRSICASGKGNCIIDAGANIGQSALTFHGLFPEAEIHCFEPSPSTYAKLEAAVKPYSKIHTFQSALGSAPGTAVLHQGVNSELNSLLAPSAHRTHQFTDKIEVPVLTIDDYLAREQISAVSLLKSDCQGYDIEVLQGASKSLANGVVHSVLAEVDFTPMYEGQRLFIDIYNYLASVGFGLYALYPMSRMDDGRIAEADALFVGRSKR